MILNLRPAPHQVAPIGDQSAPLPDFLGRDVDLPQLIHRRQPRGLQGVAPIILLFYLAPAPGVIARVSYLHCHPQRGQQVTDPTSDGTNFNDYALGIYVLHQLPQRRRRGGTPMKSVRSALALVFTTYRL